MMQKTINETKNGKIFRCSTCNKIHIEFKNINFNFSDEEYGYFTEYLLELDGEEWEYKNRGSNYKRKIILQINHRNVKIRLNSYELQELKQLFNITEKKITKDFELSFSDIKITQFLN